MMFLAYLAAFLILRSSFKKSGTWSFLTGVALFFSIACLAQSMYAYGAALAVLVWMMTGSKSRRIALAHAYA
jgi:hypothetical protein